MLVLYNVAKGTYESSGVRERLKVSSTAKSVSIGPGQVPDGFELYVQSTSPNRKLPAGYVLFEGVSGGSSSPEANMKPSVAKTSGRGGKAGPSKKRKRGEEDEDDEGDGDDDGGDGGDEGGDEEDDENGGIEKGGFIRWKILEKVDPTNMLELDDQEIVTGRTGNYDLCDEKVPEDMLENLHSQVLGVLREVKDWRETHSRTWPGKWRESVMKQFKSAKSKCRLYYFYTPDEECLVMALEKLNSFGAIVGTVGAHPFMQTNEFTYANSDGSTNAEVIAGKVTADRVLIRMLADLWHHGNDLGH
jgi:hypothetical protein